MWNKFKIWMSVWRKQVAIVLSLIALAIVLWVAYSDSYFARPTVDELEASGDLPRLDRGTQIAGPDRDSNGIRDDVDDYIALSAKKRDRLSARVPDTGKTD